MEGKGEGSWLGGQWKIPSLEAIGRKRRRFLAWWSMEDPMLGGHWNVKEKNTLSPLPFSSNNFTYALNFSP
jgi:hypothetical protein